MSNPLHLIDGRAVLHIGDVRHRLRGLPDDFFDTVITSPPYWGMRDYGTAVWRGGVADCDHRAVANTCIVCGAERQDHQLGMEPTLGEHIDNLVDVFAEVWRVLKPTGTVWLNYGDCYAAAPNGRSAAAVKAAGNDDRTFRDKPFSTVGPIYQPNHSSARGVFEGTEWNASGRGTRRVDHGGRVVAGGILKPKDLCMIPNRLAIALQEWGWWVRSEIIWGKKNAMPDSSGNGRPSTAHEKVFLLTKSGDADVWRARDTGELSCAPDFSERAPMATKFDENHVPVMAPRWIRVGSHYDASAVMQPSSPGTHARVSQNIDAQQGSTRAHAGRKTNGPMKAVASKLAPAGSGIRSNEHFVGAMKASERQKLRGQKAKAVDPRHDGQINHTGLETLDRGQGRLLRNFEPDPVIPAPLSVWQVATVAFKEAHFATFPPDLVALCIAAGAPPQGGMVLDPFGGAGTTALVALRMGRRAHIIELKPEYAEIARKRIERDWMGEDERRRDIAREQPEPPPGPLFASLGAAE